MEVVVKDAVNILHFRGDLSFTKVDENGTPLANIAFSISDTKGESHIVWTDENGYYSTAASYIPHSYHTNQEEAGAGIWFGQADVMIRRAHCRMERITSKRFAVRQIK